MDEGTTDSEGRFLLKGHEISITDIDPMLELYHDCGDENAVSEIISFSSNIENYANSVL